mmetsp:Transcript_21208/g.50419  ORF Transcript_21208/g.50419 Transcript_21208/m.50419 type:complete len:321 (+) Transcript_21208:48-1010(+)
MMMSEGPNNNDQNGSSIDTAAVEMPALNHQSANGNDNGAEDFGSSDMESLLPQDDDGNDDDGNPKRQSLEALIPSSNNDNDDEMGGGCNSQTDGLVLSGDGQLARYMDGAGGEGSTTDVRRLSARSTLCSSCCGPNLQTRPYHVGNFTILFPEQFDTGKGWGVVGPHWFGPACVWLILVGATHLCLRGVYHKNLGPVSAAICYFFFGLCTWRLTDVSFRDPGICLDRERPVVNNNGNSSSRDDYRFCDRCQVWQPPDGIHCPDCAVCISGYDHHCVWMGTCIGKRNYRQFVLFNMSWLYYVFYAFFWILTFGPIVMKNRH